MPNALPTTPTPRPGSTREVEPRFPIEERGWSRRSILAGVVGTLLFHALFFLAIPASYLDLGLDSEEQPEEFDIQLVDPDEEDEAPEPQFVETNRAAPDNVPDDTTNFSARNQQAANETVPETLSPDRTPARDGEEETPFDKIISGELTEPEPPPPPPQPPAEEPTPETPVVEPVPPERQDPLPGFEEDRTEAEEGVGTSKADPSDNPQPVDEPVEGSDREAAQPQLPVFTSPLAAERSTVTPAPRPRLPRAMPGPVRRQQAGVSQTGAVAVNAKFSEYGDYLERMVEAVSQRWHTLNASGAYRESSTFVVVEFVLTRDGLIRNMVVRDSTSQARGILLCRTAVEQGQPYGAWTSDMVEVLGEEQTITFTFHYW
jgi:hypothetical protein